MRLEPPLGAMAGGLLLAGSLPAQPATPTRSEMYVSWRYNSENFARTDMRIVQASRGTDFLLHDVASHEERGWNELFRHKPTVPQYSVRIGYVLPYAPAWAAEISFEHARFVVTRPQGVRLSGTLSGRALDSSVVLTKEVLDFRMNNGANFLLLNLVRKSNLPGEVAHSGNVALLAKAGAGLLFPHADNAVFGKRNSPAFQFGGVDVGLEAALRVHVSQRLYVELGQKGVFARYRGIKIRDGHADLDVWAHTTALSLGWSFRGDGR